MPLLLAAILVWLVLHLGVSGTRLRDVLVHVLGERGFRGIFSLISVMVLAFLVFSYRRAATVAFWTAPAWLIGVLDLAMLAASFLLVGSLTRVNPTMLGSERNSRDEPEGLIRVTRHPMLWSFAIWSIVHVLANGDLASLLFFGTFLVTVLLGMPSIDAKLARRDPQRWAMLKRHSSILPFGAILFHRNRLVPGEIGWLVPCFGVLLWIGMLALHRLVIGASPLPW